MVNLKYLTQKYFCFNIPVDYRLKDGDVINIYPIFLKDYNEFIDSYDILAMDTVKRETPLPEVIQMSYLEYLYELISQSKKTGNLGFGNKLLIILSLSLKENNINLIKDSNGKPIIAILQNNKIKIINAKEFDDIRKIILHQNIADYDDTYISSDIRKAINDTISAMSDGLKDVTLEDKMTFLGNEIGMNNSQLSEMTYREFNNRFKMSVDKMDYQINRSAELNGNVKFKKPIEHVIYKKERNKYADFFVDKNSFENKINNA